MDNIFISKIICWAKFPKFLIIRVSGSPKQNKNSFPLPMYIFIKKIFSIDIRLYFKHLMDIETIISGLPLTNSLESKKNLFHRLSVSNLNIRLHIPHIVFTTRKTIKSTVCHASSLPYNRSKNKNLILCNVP